MEYCQTVWDPYTQSNIRTLEAVQRRAARFALHRYRRQSSVSHMLTSLDWAMLAERRQNARLHMFYKIQNNLVSSEMPLTSKGRKTPTRTENIQAFQIPPSKTDYHLNSFYIKTAREWNTLPECTVQAKNLEAFNAALHTTTIRVLAATQQGDGQGVAPLPIDLATESRFAPGQRKKGTGGTVVFKVNYNRERKQTGVEEIRHRVRYESWETYRSLFALLTCGRNGPALSSRRRENSPVRLVTSELTAFGSWTVQEPRRDLKDWEKVVRLSQDTSGKVQGQTRHGRKRTGDNGGRRGVRVRGIRALRKAAREGDTDRVKQLLAEGVNPNAADGLMQVSPLHLAAQNGHHESVSVLLAAGADVNARDKDCASRCVPLLRRTVAGCVALRHMNPDPTAPVQDSPLHNAANNGHHEIVSVLLAAAADVNARGDLQESPLHLAAWNGRHETVSVLLTASADVNARDEEDNTPLHEAATYGHPKCAEILLQHGADAGLRNEHGQTAEDIAADEDTRDADPVNKDEEDRITRGRKEILKFLRQQNNEVSTRKKGYDPVLVRFYEERGMTEAKKDCPLIEDAAKQSGKTVDQVKNFIGDYRRSKSGSKRSLLTDDTGAENITGHREDLGMSAKKGGKRKAKTRHVGESSYSAPSVKRPKEEFTSVLVVNDKYGTSHGGNSTTNRQVAQFLKLHGATVHATAVQASEDDKRCATDDGVVLHLPVQDLMDKRTPSLEWLTHYHSIHYPDIPQDLKCIVGHVDVTSGAAKSIHDKRCQHAKLVLFNHDIPEETEHYMGTKKALAAGRKMEDILKDAKNADAVFSLGRRIYDYFETKYMSLGEGKPRKHFLFLPRPSPVFEAISVRPGGGEKVVLTVGRVTEVDKLKGHDLVARALGEVAEKIRNVRLCARGIDEDDYEASKRILEENLHRGNIKPTLRPCGRQEDIAQDMQQAHLVLMPSRAEPFGLIGLEAIAAGIPVLISDKSGLADMIKDLIKEKKCHPDMRHRIVKTSVRESDIGDDAKEWAKKITDTLEYSEAEFDKAAEYKKRLLESKYWEESHQNLLRVCGLND
ncbi:hypothetical protein Bbelb_087350 [Branchiostoma belcheri]|nr:hypothetical protein Bbelb_087350 [Branchiostoma belcheri]